MVMSAPACAQQLAQQLQTSLRLLLGRRVVEAREAAGAAAFFTQRGIGGDVEFACEHLLALGSLWRRLAHALAHQLRQPVHLVQLGDGRPQHHLIRATSSNACIRSRTASTVLGKPPAIRSAYGPRKP